MDLDFALRCNSLDCRSQLRDQAIVTTCSSIFCVKCAQSLGLSSTASGGRRCPACKSNLSNINDVIATQLNPSEDYKTSALIGLNPTQIMECAGRGLSFYNYQATQEILYQEYLSKRLSEKHDSLNSQLDSIINDANSTIARLRQQLEDLKENTDKLTDKYNSLLSEYSKKAKQHQRSVRDYDELKRRFLQGNVQTAAADAVERSLNSRVPLHQPPSPRSKNFSQIFQNVQDKHGYNQGASFVTKSKDRSPLRVPNERDWSECGQNQSLTPSRNHAYRTAHMTPNLTFRPGFTASEQHRFWHAESAKRM